ETPTATPTETPTATPTEAPTATPLSAPSNEYYTPMSALLIIEGTASVSSSTISDCGQTGILIYGTGSLNGYDITISNCGFGIYNNGYMTVQSSSVSNCTNGIYTNSIRTSTSNPTEYISNFRYGSLTNCTEFAVFNRNETDMLDATLSYWGSADGPSIFDSVSGTWIGTGGKVNSYVDYTGFTSVWSPL
ncbi:MAG: hypothetical protein HGA22_05320, partial [Clostridiales bacterium]|nr:hypothetical protein [Clostridiales bacterium]